MKLQTWCDTQQLSVAAFGRRIGIGSRATIARYANGTRVPPPEAMAAIVRETAGQVTPNDFYDIPAMPLASEAA